MKTNLCLNCGKEVTGKYCSYCGQKSSVHRFSLRNFVLHDFIHGIFHLDSGILFTVKSLFRRPGHFTREYIDGKRVKYFNAFTLIVIVLSIGYIISQYAAIDPFGFDFNKDMEVSGYKKVVKNYSKLVTLLGIPLYALCTYLFYRRAKKNFAEHLVLNTYLLCGTLIIELINKLLMLSDNIKVVTIIVEIILTLETVYYVWFLYQFFSVFGYKKWLLILRCLFVAHFIQFLLMNNIIPFVINKIGTYLG